MSKKDKIVIATGGTGGHIFPALSLSEYLNTNFDIEFFSDKRGIKYFNNTENIRLIDTGSIFQKNIFKVIVNLNKIFFSVINSFFYLKKNRPKIVFGMGGYSSFPVCVASYFLKIPVIIYEPNLVIGKANKILLPIVKKIFIASKNISGIQSKYKNKIFVSGYFLRKEIFQIEKIYKEKNNPDLTLLIMGGSQSAEVFGEKIPEIIVECYKRKIKFKIFQQCLDKQIKKIEEIYKKNNINFKLFTFSDKLSDHYRTSDLAITRSGASSIAELLNTRIPFIAIPLPTSAENHQYKNALEFENNGYCFLLNEKTIIPKLFEILEDLNKNRDKLLLLKNKMREHSDKDSLDKVVNFIEKFLNEKN
tara:strand:- start:6761 stop:7846 length:1086 start_codon:yes stop_codon:yes gene_type:complete